MQHPDVQSVTLQTGSGLLEAAGQLTTVLPQPCSASCKFLSHLACHQPVLKVIYDEQLYCKLVLTGSCKHMWRMCGGLTEPAAQCAAIDYRRSVLPLPLWPTSKCLGRNEGM